MKAMRTHSTKKNVQNGSYMMYRNYANLVK